MYQGGIEMVEDTKVMWMNAGELLVTFKSVEKAEAFHNEYGGMLFTDKIYFMFADNELDLMDAYEDALADRYAGTLNYKRTRERKTEYYTF